MLPVTHMITHFTEHTHLGSGRLLSVAQITFSLLAPDTWQ